ncbi:MAG: dTMP kinase [Desulfobacteraceae bacterium]|nr:dTMP kinase [Desulfobacteraceae bacterium]
MTDGTRPGRLIALEGIDGTGKSTQVALLAEALRRDGFQVIATREPTDGPHGQRIRALYQARDSVSREQELALFLEDRRQHVDELIRPALARGQVVLTDRYYLSTAAYQGGNDWSSEEIIRLNEAFAPRPDLVILLVLSPEEAVARIRRYRGEAPNHFEQEAGLRQVAGVFARLAGDYIRRLDAAQPVVAVHEQALALARELLGAVTK